MAGGGSGAVLLALLGNGLITVIKAIAFAISGSGAMLSESIHSFADTSNQALLFIGIRRSQRPADRAFHYGYGVERFFFALMSAVGIFILGAGVTIYHGVVGVFSPPALSVGWVTFAVLGVSFVVEGFVLLRAIQEVNRMRGTLGFVAFVRSGTDPTVLAVLFEDFVACLGVLVAAGCLGLAQVTGNPVWDGVGSIVIGAMLALVALWLAWRNRELILGPALPRAVERDILHMLSRRPSVAKIHTFRSRILGADRFRINAQIDYDGRVLAREHLDWVAEQAGSLGDPDIRRAFVEEFGERVLNSLAREIDAIEVDLRGRYPELVHIDLESDLPEGEGAHITDARSEIDE